MSDIPTDRSTSSDSPSRVEGDLPAWIEKIKAWRWRSMARRVAKFTVWIAAILAVLYLWGMIFYNGPLSQAGVGNFLLACLWVVAIWFIYRRFDGWKNKLLVVVLAIAIVIIPWSFIRPSNDRPWSPEFAQTGRTEIVGDVVTFINLRNFDYTKSGEVTERWETRTVHLSNLRGLELFHDTFMGDLMAHPILSYDFGPEGYVCLSVETRREVGEKFSPFGGLYKMFELQYLFSTEEDCIRLRTNIRKEPVYLYEIDAPLEEIREMFLTSVRIQNELADRPKFYNVITANCTTSLRAQRPTNKQGTWDRRILFNGLLDEWLYERGRLKTYGLSFPELRKKCQISEAARKAHDDKGFFKAIREPRSKNQ